MPGRVEGGFCSRDVDRIIQRRESHFWARFNVTVGCNPGKHVES
ncbi:hypothetical protein BOSEA31B_15135 [Hyphomicrobiales bacterium]|nr:hypothetical protein BOSEA31B_15135 [Hyphomicrobiales bacterium]CAH1701626.1 hypothetical protein BOSEA1005_21325 [Hyphomicrobiales bacterium]CAI0345792.1 hypothetical protein BO1005MUT1_450020 [Hyphomicrobiales bacterium]